MKKTLVSVIYHAECTDGFGAAWAAWKRFDGDAHYEAEYIPAKYGSTPPDTAGKEVFILDFSYPAAVTLEMAKNSKKITILDHHKSAKDDLLCLSALNMENLSIHFNMEKSGAVLAWEHFFPCTPIPWLLKYVQDRDLWQWRLPRSKAVSASLYSYNMDFSLWDDLLLEDYRTLADEGESILRYEGKQAERILKGVWEGDIGGTIVPCVNSPVLQSELGNIMCQGRPFAAVWSTTEGSAVISLRSDENGMDVSEVAKKFGGGGHKHAAGYKIILMKEEVA